VRERSLVFSKLLMVLWLAESFRPGTMSVELGLQGVQIGEGVMMRGISLLVLKI